MEQLNSLNAFGKPGYSRVREALSTFEALYHKHGNAIALQYGGSNMVKTIENFSGISNSIIQHGNLMEIVIRGYSNIFTGIRVFPMRIKPSPVH